MAMKTVLSSSLSQGAKNKINENFAELAGKSGASTTATAAELNYLDIVTLGTGAASKAVVLDAGDDYIWPAAGVLRVGVLQDVDGVALTATATELNLIDGSVAGTAVASKALVLGADKNVDMIAIADGGLALGAGAGTVVTATAAELNILDDVTATSTELNYLDIDTLGTGAASKAVVLDSGDDYTWPPTGILTYGVLADSATTLTATVAELNILDTVIATAAELNLVDDICANITIAYATSGTTDGIEVTFTVQDAAGVDIDAIHTLNVWVSDDEDGSGLTDTAASGALTAVVGTILTALTAKKHIVANTAATGILTLLLVDSANTINERFCVANPVNGKAIVGPATVVTNYEGGT